MQSLDGSLLIDRSLFQPFRNGEFLHIEESPSGRTILVLSEDKASLPQMRKALSEIGEILSKRPITCREEVIARFHLIKRIDHFNGLVSAAKQVEVPLTTLFPKAESWTSIGTSTVLGKEYLLLSQTRRSELMTLLNLSSNSISWPESDLEAVLIKKATFATLQPSAQIEALIELYEENEDSTFQDRLKNLFAGYATELVLRAIGFADFTEEKLQTLALPPLCANLRDWILLLSQKHWEEVPKAVFLALASQVPAARRFSTSENLSQEKFQNLYLRYDPELTVLPFLASQSWSPNLLQHLLPAKNFEQSCAIMAKAPQTAVRPFFSLGRSARTTGYIGRFLSPQQIENLSPDEFKKGVVSISDRKSVLPQHEDLNLTSWISLLLAKGESDDPTIPPLLTQITTTLILTPEGGRWLSGSSPELVWKLLFAIHTDDTVATLLCSGISGQTWGALLQTPNITTLVLLFTEGLLILVADIAPHVERLNQQAFTDLTILSSLVRGCNTYFEYDALYESYEPLEQFKIKCEKLRELLSYDFPNVPTSDSEKFFSNNVSILSRGHLLSLAAVKKKALIAHVLRLKLPGLKIILSLLEPSEADPLDAELIEAIRKKDERLVSLWTSMKDSDGEEKEAAFDKYGTKY